MAKKTIRVKTHVKLNECICEGCGCKVKYKSTDTHIGFMGTKCVVCPDCGYETAVSDRVKPPTFPTTFLYNGSKHDDDATINSMVQRIIQEIKKSNSKEDYYYIEGSTLAIAIRDEGGYVFYVAKDFWTEYLEEKDLKV